MVAKTRLCKYLWNKPTSEVKNKKQKKNTGRRDVGEGGPVGLIFFVPRRPSLDLALLSSSHGPVWHLQEVSGAADSSNDPASALGPFRNLQL